MLNIITLTVMHTKEVMVCLLAVLFYNSLVKQIYLIAHDMRSTHNVGSLFRTAEGLGVDKLYLTGYTPYPAIVNDDRLPHLVISLTKKIQKTSLGAHEMLVWEYNKDLVAIIDQLRDKGFKLAALEQSADSIPLNTFKAPEKLVLLLGTETTGIPQELLAKCDYILEIPMLGQKESFNVVQAAAMALYQLRFN